VFIGRLMVAAGFALVMSIYVFERGYWLCLDLFLGIPVAMLLARLGVYRTCGAAADPFAMVVAMLATAEFPMFCHISDAWSVVHTWWLLRVDHFGAALIAVAVAFLLTPEPPRFSASPLATRL
jgi:hypothetical protein